MQDKAQYWLTLCEEDIKTARWLLDGGRFLHMGFFCNMIAEKALKAVIASQIDDPPPKSHDLYKLAERANLSESLTEKQNDLLFELIPLQIEGRYSDYKEDVAKRLNKDECKRILQETEAFLCWIKKQLGK